MRVDARGTEFAVAAIPIGGYVRMLDDRDPEQRELLQPGSKAYMDLHPKWRIAIALGGPFANLLLAALLYAVLQLAGSLEPIPMTQAPAAGSPRCHSWTRASGTDCGRGRGCRRRSGKTCSLP